jgi:hypothetical protein
MVLSSYPNYTLMAEDLEKTQNDRLHRSLILYSHLSFDREEPCLRDLLQQKGYPPLLSDILNRLLLLFIIYISLGVLFPVLYPFSPEGSIAIFFGASLLLLERLLQLPRIRREIEEYDARYRWRDALD